MYISDKEWDRIFGNAWERAGLCGDVAEHDGSNYRNVARCMDEEYLRYVLEGGEDWTPKWVEAVEQELDERALDAVIEEILGEEVS